MEYYDKALISKDTIKVEDILSNGPYRDNITIKTVVLLIGALALASASVDLSKVKRIEELDEFWEQLDPSLQKLRGTNAAPDSRVVNGKEAKPGQFPYQALVVTFFENGSGGLCGGSLLTQNFVMTAAHCVVSGSPPSHGTITLGAINRQVEEETQQRIAHGTINVHPNYTASSLRNDIATIQLSTPAVFNDFVQPIDLPAISDTRRFSGFMGIVSGFGRTTNYPPASDVLMYSSNPILTNANCQSSWIQEQNICLSGHGGRSVCFGDSGGPLAVRENNRTIQVGITSFVHWSGCDTGHAAGFARVSYFLSWIAENSDVVLRD
ncbi:brachyurin-like [Malaya genurostris]|uniref:brachyurin-like n=1 Tax=Malaya genurostris TaxID=325434 RepID=UPI0026F3CDE7|nr:brachyurin-like [Malaya genurostris]